MEKLIDFRYENKLGLLELAREHPAAVSRALNQTAASARTAISSAVREEFNIKKQDLDKGIEVKKSTKTSLIAAVIVRGARLGVGMFGARKLKGNRMVSFAIKRGDRKTAKAFFVWGRGKSGADRGRAIVYHRLGAGRHNIKEMLTISASDMAGSKAVEKQVAERIDEQFLKEMDHQLKVELSGLVPSSAAKGWKTGGALGGRTYAERKAAGDLR
jgi:hypothetical protein